MQYQLCQYYITKEPSPNEMTLSLPISRQTDYNCIGR
nr:MAG TPA: hypothetical protein [Caudoviricetes sp.]DAW00231.1 MAG TPA: hypothetical protein [Caudoviricetes sp.]